MKSSFLPGVILFGILSLIASVGTAQQSGKINMDRARSEIEKLHQQDISATLSSDVNQLLALWSEDGVLIGQGDKLVVGKEAIRASLTEYFAKNPTTKVLSYQPDIRDLQIHGDVAYEWGYFSATQQASPTSKPVSFRARFLRVMKRQSDGSWKFVRVMWNTEGQ